MMTTCMILFLRAEPQPWRKNHCLGIRWYWSRLAKFIWQPSSFKKNASTWICLHPRSAGCGSNKWSLHISKHQNNRAGIIPIRKLVLSHSNRSAKRFALITVRLEFWRVSAHFWHIEMSSNHPLKMFLTLFLCRNCWIQRNTLKTIHVALCNLLQLNPFFDSVESVSWFNRITRCLYCSTRQPISAGKHSCNTKCERESKVVAPYPHGWIRLQRLNVYSRCAFTQHVIHIVVLHSIWNARCHVGKFFQVLVIPPVKLFRTL